MMNIDREKKIRTKCIWIISIIAFSTFVYVTWGIEGFKTIGAILIAILGYFVLITILSPILKK